MARQDQLFGQPSQAEMRRLLLGDVPGWPLGESPDDETQRALGEAHGVVAARGRGHQDLELLLARAVVRLSSLIVEARECDRASAPAVDAVASMDRASETAELSASLSGARDKVRAMMRQFAHVTERQERVIVLMLDMLANKDHRISDHTEWVLELGQLSGAGE